MSFIWISWSLSQSFFDLQPACLSGSPYQPNGTSFNCFRSTPSAPYHGRRGGGGHGKGRLNWDSDIIVPKPPAVTSNAGIPDTRQRCKQGWALSKRGSKRSGAGASLSWGETEEVLRQDCDTEYQWNSTEEEERSEVGERGRKKAVELWQVGQG